tara:strand:- start:213 stop:653 length:441 start_codon:yes stop_codon:yes gene_type:complete
MALIGGGGSPNTVGSNPSGTGKGLVYVGNGMHAGWSGTVDIAAAGTAVTQFEFTSPSDNIIVNYRFGINENTVDTNSYYGFTISLDGQFVYQQTVRFSATNSGTSDLGTKLVIPAFSKVKIQSITTDTSGTTATYGVITAKEVNFA